MGVENPEAFRCYVHRLGEVADVNIRTFGDFTDALQRRHDFFHAEGCRLSDHGLEEFYADPASVLDTMTELFTLVPQPEN